MGRKSTKIRVRSNVYNFPETVYNSTAEAKNGIIKYCENNDISIVKKFLKYDFTEYMKREDLNQDHQCFICTYENDINSNSNEEWIQINTLTYKVFSQKTLENNSYNFTSIESRYKISNLGSYTDGVIVTKHNGIAIKEAKKQFSGYKNIALQYLLASAFVPNPKKYSLVEVQQNGIKVDSFFEGFDARHDIIWIPNVHKVDDIKIHDDINKYQIEYIYKELDIDLSEKNIERTVLEFNYTSIGDTVLEDSWTPIPDISNYEIDKRGHVRL